MKIVAVPGTCIETATPEGRKKSLSFVEWCQTALDLYAPLGKGPKAARQAAKIFEALEKANGTIAFEDADFDVLKAATEACDWIAKINRQAEPYWSAVEKAQDVTAGK